MVSFYKPQPRQARPSFELDCTSLDLRCRGAGRAGGKVWFCEGLLPGELGKVQERGGHTAEAVLLRRLSTSPLRRLPDCPQQHACGGCPLQYIPPDLALRSKTEGIRRLFARSCAVDLGECAAVVPSPEPGYRRACRLSACRDHGRLHLGFREAKSHKLSELRECLVLAPRLGALLLPLAQQLNRLDARFDLGHAELLDSDDLAAVNLRFGCILGEADCGRLREFAAQQHCLVSLTEPVPAGPAVPAGAEEELMALRLIAGEPQRCFVHAGALELRCLPSDFVQVNQKVSAALTQMVTAAFGELAGQRLLDLYCGLGNFSLPLAAAGAEVCGVDIVREMIRRAQENAARLALSRAEFVCADLSLPFASRDFAKKEYDAVLLDPGRSGAAEAMAFVCRRKIRRVVLVSCNPRAAARDCSALFRAGWHVRDWAVFDMFPRTSHIEMLLNLEL